ncbi:MAG: GGDEF domain-containing protein [Ruminococcus sp.]|nr:GGDEF domain-containing protein [Ruminococcus sp.]
MELSAVRKVSVVVNTVILLLVFGLAAFFAIIKVPFLVAFSVPTACIYLVGYFLIHKDKLDIYVWMIYCWLTLYMGVTTLCLGYGYGFHLYCFSMIPIMFVTEYIAYKLERRSMRALPVSIVIAIFYILCTGYVSYFGPVYERDQKYAALFWIFNALTVFGFLIYYTYYIVQAVIVSEGKLKEAAFIDKLTGLYNRHYMFDRLVALTNENSGNVLAMTDIDNFKHINDTYGHNAGDMVLQAVSERMRTVCTDCVIARWGGEEFLIVSKLPAEKACAMLEELRQCVESSPVSCEGTDISVTLTIGAAEHADGQNADEWVKVADSRLYYGKNHGKNQVVAEDYDG